MRTKIISPVIDSFKNEKNTGGNNLVLKLTNYPGTTYAGFNNQYNPILPYSLNIFSTILKSFSFETISDLPVKTKTLQILNTLNEAIMNIPDKDNINQYLSKLHLVEQDDKSILIEWIFYNFRIGFVVCQPVEDSYYFFISQEIDSFVSKSERIGNNLNTIVQHILKYIIENT